MSGGADRFVRALGIGAALWIAIYWIWDPAAGRSSVQRPAADEIERRESPPEDSARGHTPAGGAEPGPPAGGRGTRTEPATDHSAPTDPDHQNRSPETTTRTHVVQPNQTLSAIADHHYGRATLADRIYQANRDRLDDPDDLDVGQRLRIPPAPDDE